MSFTFSQLNKTLRNLTFRQRFLLFAATIFLLCVPFPLYWLIKGQNLFIESAANNIESFKHQKICSSLLNDAVHYRLSIVDDREYDVKNYKKRILTHMSTIKNRQSDEAARKQLPNPLLLKKIWQRIWHQESPSKEIYFKQTQRFIDVILNELEMKTIRNDYWTVNLLPNNPIIHSILFELYRTQAFTVELATWYYLLENEPENREKYQRSFYIADHFFQNAIEEIQRMLNTSGIFQSDPVLHNHQEMIQSYLKDLDNWRKHIQKESNQNSKKPTFNLVEKNRLIVESLLSYGMDYNQTNKNRHVFIKNICIAVISMALGIVLFYILFRALTGHFLELNDHIQALARGKFKKCFCSDAGDEFGPVGRAFDTMAKTVQQIVQELQRLGRQLAESIKNIVQSINDQSQAFMNDEKQIKEAEDYTQTLVDQGQSLVKAMTELSLSSQQKTLSEAAEITLKKMSETISSLTMRSSNILQHLAKLKVKLENNKNLFPFLEDVSNQASLLSLNSAIVAANIVTDKPSFIKISYEIKRFADKTAASTEGIQKIIEGIFLNIDNIQEDTTKFLNELNESAEKVKIVENRLSYMTAQLADQTEKFQNINKTMQNQANLVDDIKKALDDLSHVADENNGQARLLGQAMDGLIETTVKLQRVLNLFFRPHFSQKSQQLILDE